MSIPPAIYVEVVEKDNNNCTIKLRFTGLNPDKSTKIYWLVYDGSGNALSDDMLLEEVPKGYSTWTSPVLSQFYLTIDEETGRNVYTDFTSGFSYDIWCNVTVDGEQTSFCSTGPFEFEIVWRGLPYVSNFTFKQTGDESADISCRLNTVYSTASETGIIGTKFQLYLETSTDTMLLADGYLHEAIKNNGAFPGYNYIVFRFDYIGYDGESVDMSFSVLAQHGDKYIIRMTNQYYDDGDIGPSTASIVLDIVSRKTPKILYESIPEDVYSYDGGRVTGKIYGNISIKAEDWNDFIAILQQYYDHSGIDWGRIYAVEGEGLTAERWNAVIRTLKKHYDLNGNVLDDKIQEVIKGQRIYPEMIMRVNHAFNI